MEKRMVSDKREDVKALIKAAADAGELNALDSFRLEIDEALDVHIHGVKSVVICELQEIVLQCRKVTVSLKGENLWLRSFSCSETLLSGDIRQIMFL